MSETTREAPGSTTAREAKMADTPLGLLHKQLKKDAAMSRQRAADAIQTWDTDTILAALGCTERDTWLGATLRREMANRGLGHEGTWVGFARSFEVWGVER